MAFDVGLRAAASIEILLNEALNLAIVRPPDHWTLDSVPSQNEYDAMRVFAGKEPAGARSRGGEVSSRK
jgi:hypothetical protein